MCKQTKSCELRKQSWAQPETITVAGSAGRWMLFGVSMAGAPSVAAELLIGQPPAAAAAATTRASFAGTAASGSGAEATDTGGTAAEIEADFRATPAEPAVPYPARLQND